MTYKQLKQTVRSIKPWLAVMAWLGLVFLPAQALAASKTYVVDCVGSNVQLHGSTLACSASPAVVKLEGIGVAKTPFPQGAGVATITVDCGRSSPVDPSIGGAAVFKCRNGAAPKISNLKQVQSGHAPAAPVTPSGPPTSCNASHCDLIATYINPAINVLSGIFGLIAVISLIMGGIQYAASEGDPQKVSRAKDRLAKTVVAIFAFALLYGFLQFLIPGGLP